MAKLDIINLKGEKVKDLKLNDEIFNIEANEIVLKKAIDLQLASLRQGTAKTKTRAEVSGGGRKPYKQKGTGNARQGSIRAPHYRGGGIAFGVSPRSYTFKMNKKERTLALKSALSLKAQAKELVVVESLELSSLKTKDLKEMLKTMNLSGKVLFICSSDAENLYMASRNLPNTLVLLANEINVYDIVNADTVVVEEQAINYIEEVLK
jgi:large subunit ribosomal protein L4